jgi:hypothetical protein
MPALTHWRARHEHRGRAQATYGLRPTPWGLAFAAGALFTTTPTTIAGIAALLDELVVDPYSKKEAELGVDAGELVIEWALGDEDNREDAINLMTTLASVLRTHDAALRPNGEAQS